jgi:hypothetical protein
VFFGFVSPTEFWRFDQQKWWFKQPKAGVNQDLQLIYNGFLLGVRNQGTPNLLASW